MTSPREKLANIMDQCGLNAREIAPLFGKDESTVRAYLNGEHISSSAARWIDRVQSIVCTPRTITVTFRASGEKPGQAFGHRKLGPRRGTK